LPQCDSNDDSSGWITESSQLKILSAVPILAAHASKARDASLSEVSVGIGSMSQPAARGWRRFVGVLVATLCVAVAYQRHAAGEAPGTAMLTRWDLFAAAGTRNPNGITLHPNDGTVWMVAQNLGSLRLGQLDPDAAGPNYLEWTVPGVTGVAGPPVGLTLDSATGNVWFTTGGSPQLMVQLPGGVFRSFTLTALTSPNLHRFALSADGSTAFVPVQASGQTSIYRIPLGNGSSPLAGVERWRLTGSTDNPRHLTIDSIRTPTG
jgi:hypothetical protein